MMTEFTQAPPQSAETIAGFRDGQPWLVLEPTTVREWRKVGGEWLPNWEWPGGGEVDIEARIRTVPVQVPDPVPCPECDGEGIVGISARMTFVFCSACGGSAMVRGSGSVQRPLLVPTWQCRGRHHDDSWTEWSAACSTQPDANHERRLAGVVLHPSPVYLPVWEEQACGTDLMAPEHVCHDNGRLLHHLPDTGSMFTETEFDITDQFSTPPPVGALLVDMSDAVWLEGDDVVTEREVGLSFVNQDTDTSTPSGTCRVPLSAATTLTTVELA